MQIQEICEMRAKGTALYPFINAIRSSCIPCMDQYCKKEVFCCTVRRTDVKQLRELAEAYSITLQIQEMPSLLGKLRKYRKRLGIVVGMLLAAGLLFYYSNVVTKIDIEGLSTIPEAKILAILEAQGVTEGTWIGEIDFHACEHHLRLELPEVAWAGLRTTGSRLVVHIYEATLPKTEMLSERTPCNIVSLYDAQITGCTIYDGRLMRIIGDGVKQGEILVSGILQDDKGHTSYHHALGSVTGIYTQEMEFTEYFSVSDTQPTGRIQKQRWFWLYQLHLPLQFPQRQFEESQKWESSVPFSLFGHSLPCGILQRTYAEQVTSVIVQTEEEAQNALHEQIFRYEKNLLKDVEILDKSMEYTTDENGITCHITYTLEGEIGQTSEIFVK